MDGKTYDALIIGAGPAGSVAARFLAEAGLDVLLVDKKVFPRRKVCGDGLTPRGTRNLISLGLGAFLRANARYIEGYLFRFSHAETIPVSLDLNRLYPPFSYTIARSRLDHELLRLARERGAHVLEGHRFLGLERDGAAGWKVTLEGKGGGVREKRATLIVGADGAPSAVARSLVGKGPSPGLKGVALSCYMRGVEDLGNHMEFILDREILPGAGWIFPLDDELANVGVAVMNYTHPKIRTSIVSLWRKMLETSPSASARLRRAKVVDEPRAGLLPFHMFQVHPVGRGFLLAGDAAGLVNPFCGEGVAFALESGWLAARAALQAWPRLDASEMRHYGEELRHLYEVPFDRGRLFYRFTQNPTFMHALYHTIGDMPRFSKFLFALSYRKGASQWKKLFPREEETFRLPGCWPLPPHA